MSRATSWDDRLREEPYQGVLFVSREAIASLTGSNGRNILDASLDGDEIRVTWMDGSKATLRWPTLQERGGLDRLGDPHLVFVSEGDAIGLLFTSRTPHEGLQFVEPHSPIAPVGWLTARGLEEEARS
jgi:hypothetical protein